MLELPVFLSFPELKRIQKPQNPNVPFVIIKRNKLGEIERRVVPSRRKWFSARDRTIRASDRGKPWGPVLILNYHRFVCASSIKLGAGVVHGPTGIVEAMPGQAPIGVAIEYGERLAVISVVLDKP